jgi:bifunctional DNase/RNase
MLRELKVRKNSVVIISTAFGNRYVIVARDPTTNSANSAFPIFTGPLEAQAIQAIFFAVQDTAVPRPQTHDLFRNVLVEIGWMLSKVIITELKDDVYYANVYLEMGGRELIVDSRPSDAIALALRFSSPIYIEEEVLLRSLDSENTKHFLETLEIMLPEIESESESF